VYQPQPAAIFFDVYRSSPFYEILSLQAVLRIGCFLDFFGIKDGKKSIAGIRDVFTGL
jgi:hypothetical protein